ncbi:MAG: hypothetical protein Rubg2KO_36700 [Rubricoccaceae bacterium]
MNAIRPSDSLTTPPVSRTDAVAPGNASVRDAQQESVPSAPTTDKVDISPEARTRAAESRPTEGASPEIETARVALRAETLSDARLHELRERVRTGHYNQPEAIDRIAGAVLKDVDTSPR